MEGRAYATKETATKETAMATDKLTHTQRIVKIIADKYDFDFDDLFNLVELELEDDTMASENTDAKPDAKPDAKLDATMDKTNADAYDDDTCHAYVRDKYGSQTDGVCRCSRNKSIGDFCKPHHHQYINGALLYGAWAKARPDAKLRNVRRVTLGAKEYFHEPATNSVYTIPRLKKNRPIFVGYLNETKDGELCVSL